MGVFFKHLIRTVKKAPLQPLLILLTIILSVAVGVTAFRFGSVFFIRSGEMRMEEVALGDIVINSGAERPNGILFDSDAKELLGDKAEVLGDFSLIAFRNGENGKKQPIAASAIDLAAADGYFLFDYYAYGGFNTENLESSVIISKSYADKSGLSVGDSVRVLILNEELEYKVQAVAEDSGILLKKDMLLPIESVIGLLAKRSVFIASLGDSFIPYNRLMIRVGKGVDAEEVAGMLSESKAFEGCRVDNMSKNTDGESFAVFESVATLMLSLLVCGLAVLLIITSQSLMQKQRSMEYALFSAAGASRDQLAALQYFESLIYAALGGLAGILLSPYMLSYTVKLFSWQRYSVAVGFEGIIFGGLLSVALCFIGTFVTVNRDKKRELASRLNEGNYPKVSREGYGVVIVLGIIVAVCLAVAMISPIKYRYIPIILLIVAFTVLLYASSGHIIRCVATVLEKLSNGKRGGGAFLLSVKNLKNNHTLRHSGRLLSVLFALLCAIFICSGELTRQYDAFDNIIEGEIIAVNMNSETVERIKKDAQVEGVSTFYYSDAVMINGKYEVMTIFTSGDSKACISKDFVAEKMPDAGEIVISKSAAGLLDVRLGDKVSVDVNGRTHKVSVIEICDVNIPMVYMDCSYVAANMKMNCIKLKDGIEVGSEEYGEITAEIFASGAQIIDEKEITGTIMNTIDGFTSLVAATVVISVIISLVGCANVFGDNVIMRRREREILHLCGMEKRKILKMHMLEIVITLILALILGVAVGFLLCVGLNVGLGSFGFALF